VQPNRTPHVHLDRAQMLYGQSRPLTTQVGRAVVLRAIPPCQREVKIDTECSSSSQPAIPICGISTDQNRDRSRDSEFRIAGAIPIFPWHPYRTRSPAGLHTSTSPSPSARIGASIAARSPATTMVSASGVSRSRPIPATSPGVTAASRSR